MRRPYRSSPELVPPLAESDTPPPIETDAPEVSFGLAHDKASGMHIRSADVPTRWLDRLFLATCELPIDAGERAVVDSLVRALAEVFPDRAVGARLSVRNKPAELVRYVPPGQEGRAAGGTPTRMFPGFDAELVVAVGASETTLHLAAETVADAAVGSPEHDLLRRAALAMERGLSVARAQARARGSAQELRALSAHMVQAEKLASLGQLAAGIVHELNNPLTSIVVYTDVLLRKQVGAGADPQDVERLRRIGESAGRMLRFTRDLITYARPSREVPVPVSLHAVMDQALAFCEHVLHESKVEVERRFTSDGATVRGMPEQLVQVFVNLVTNACHAMSEGQGCLTLSTLVEGEHVVVCLEDDGCGIPPENLASVFTPFFTTKGAGKGTGLGLSIVKNILDGHNAQIGVEARAERGTRFTLRFPRSPG